MNVGEPLEINQALLYMKEFILETNRIHAVDVERPSCISYLLLFISEFIQRRNLMGVMNARNHSG